jgi:hypothetical protein
MCVLMFVFARNNVAHRRLVEAFHCVRLHSRVGLSLCLYLSLILFFLSLYWKASKVIAEHVTVNYMSRRLYAQHWNGATSQDTIDSV